MLPRNCCHPIVATQPHQMLPAKCCQPRNDDDATTTTTRRRGSGDGAGESLQPPGALTVAAGPKCPQSLQPPSGRCSLCGHSPQALPVSWAPCNPSSRCSPLTPHSVAAAPRRPSVTAPKRTLTVAAASWAPCSPRPHCSPSLLIQEDG